MKLIAADITETNGCYYKGRKWWTCYEEKCPRTGVVSDKYIAHVPSVSYKVYLSDQQSWTKISTFCYGLNFFNYADHNLFNKAISPFWMINGAIIKTAFWCEGNSIPKCVNNG